MNYFADEFRRKIAARRQPGSAQTTALAKESDFRLGAATVRPSVRTVTGPSGRVTAEPRVMQVLVALAVAGGKVLTRDDLIDKCWNGQIVGDDSVNRAIAEVRRIARETSAGFVVETIPRIGYRLSEGQSEDGVAASADPQHDFSPSRRNILAGSVAAATAIGLGAWYFTRPRLDPEAAALIERGRQALRDELPHSDAQGIGFLRRAVAIEPGNAEAWGLLAMAFRNAVEHSGPGQTATAVRECETAARRALSLDAREGNALTALATMRPSFGDWSAAEGRLRRVLELAPGNVAALGHLTVLLQSAGLETESNRYNELAAAADPLSPVHQFRRGWKLWIRGRLAEADQVIDRTLQLFPLHPAVWNVRMVLFALTGRTEAARNMVENAETRPPTINAAMVANWRLSLTALQTRSQADIEAARRSLFRAVVASPGAAINGIMILSELRDLDAAFEVANGYLLRRGSLIGSLRPSSAGWTVNDQRWRKTQMLFTPAVVPMQADRRFMIICEELGLADYWRRRGTRPDFLLR